MIASEIMLPPHAPEIYLDRATLWNAVENCEKHPKAQLAYSFDIKTERQAHHRLPLDFDLLFVLWNLISVMLYVQYTAGHTVAEAVDELPAVHRV